MTVNPSTGDVLALEWVKSSYSSNEGPDCVEVAWHKSSHSSSEPDSSCVEVSARRGIVLVRDSKNITGPRFGVAPGTWAVFLAHVSAG